MRHWTESARWSRSRLSCKTIWLWRRIWLTFHTPANEMNKAASYHVTKSPWPQRSMKRRAVACISVLWIIASSGARITTTTLTRWSWKEPAAIYTWSNLTKDRIAKTGFAEKVRIQSREAGRLKSRLFYAKLQKLPPHPPAITHQDFAVNVIAGVGRKEDSCARQIR